MIAFPRSLQPASREQPVRDQASERASERAGDREGREKRLVQLLDGWMDGWMEQRAAAAAGEECTQLVLGLFRDDEGEGTAGETASKSHDMQMAITQTAGSICLLIPFWDLSSQIQWRSNMRQLGYYRLKSSLPILEAP